MGQKISKIIPNHDRATNIVRLRLARSVGGDIPEASTPQSAAEELTNGLKKTARNLIRLSELLHEMDRLCRTLPLPDSDAAGLTMPSTAQADTVPALAVAPNTRLLEKES